MIPISCIGIMINNSTEFQNISQFENPNRWDADIPATVDYIYIVLRLLTSVFGFCGNLLVLVSVWRNIFLQTANNVLIASLSVADVFTSLNGPISMLLYLGNKHLNESEHKVLLSWACVLKTLLDLFGMAGNVGSIFLIALDRFISVTFPIKYLSTISKKKVSTLVLVLWAYLAMISPILSQYAYSAYSYCDIVEFLPNWAFWGVLVGQFMLVSMVTAVLYLRIAYVAWIRSNKVSTTIVPVSYKCENAPISVTSVALVPNCQPSARIECHNTHSKKTACRNPKNMVEHHTALNKDSTSARQEQQLQILNLMGLVLGVYFLLYLPLIILSMFPAEDAYWYPTVLRLSAVLFYTNAAVNPAIYAWRNQNFKRAFKITLRLKDK